MGKIQLLAVFDHSAMVRHTAHMVQVDDVGSAAAVKSFEFRKLFKKLIAADADQQFFFVFQIDPLIFVFCFAV